MWCWKWKKHTHVYERKRAVKHRFYSKFTYHKSSFFFVERKITASCTNNTKIDPTFAYCPCTLLDESLFIVLCIRKSAPHELQWIFNTDHTSSFQFYLPFDFNSFAPHWVSDIDFFVVIVVDSNRNKMIVEVERWIFQLELTWKKTQIIFLLTMSTGFQVWHE